MKRCLLLLLLVVSCQLLYCADYETSSDDEIATDDAPVSPLNLPRVAEYYARVRFNDDVLMFGMPFESTVDDVKRKIEELEGIPVEMQTLRDPTGVELADEEEFDFFQAPRLKIVESCPLR